MKLKRVLLMIMFISGLQPFPANASVSPIVESFTFSPTEIDLSGEKVRVDFELIVSHPFGIENSSVKISLRNSRNDSVLLSIFRTDQPIQQSKTKVTFKGGIDVPRNIATGVYSVIASDIKNNSAAGYQFSSGDVESPKLRQLIGAESGLLVRNQDNLDLDYDTFIGPTFGINSNFTYTDFNRYNRTKQPVWRVGEILDPTEYFELKVPSLSLNVSTATPTTCVADEKIIKFIAVGQCDFKVFTPKTNEYRSKTYSDNKSIGEARIKIELYVDKLPDQKAIDLPRKINIMPVYSAAAGYILAQSETPQTCLSSGFTVQIIRGGTCTLSYQSPDTSVFKASKVYLQTFEIVRTPQTLEFAPLSSVDLKSKSLSLSATASSGAAVTFTAEPAANCTVTENTLNLLKAGKCSVTAQQAGTATIAPISKTVTISITGKAARELRTISCVKGSKKVTVTKAKPKCPKGYSRVR